MSTVLLDNCEYLFEKNLLGCSQISCQSLCGTCIFKSGSSGFQGRQPITSCSLHMVNVKCRAAVFSNGARFYPLLPVLLGLQLPRKKQEVLKR